MHAKRTRNALAVMVGVFSFSASASLVAQVVQPSANATAPASSVTLDDLARMAQEIEVEKSRKTLRELKKETSVSNAPIIIMPKKVKPAPKPDMPEGLQVRAIFGVAPKTYVRFYTSTGEFEDRLIGQSVQGWSLVDIKDGTVRLQRGKTIYPIALQMRPAGGDAEAVGAQFQAGNVVNAAALPDPRIGSAR